MHTGAPFRETFSVVPDFPGYTRALRHVFALIMAHSRYNGTYKWLLLGDDDTIWSLRGALQLLNDMGVSSEQPYMITDFMFKKIGDVHYPLASDERCDPCEPGVRYCPCRIKPACRVNGTRHHSKGDFAIEDRNCVIWFQGGSGIMYSAGMMAVLTQDPHLQFHVAFSGVAEFGDWIMGETARAAGYGYTAPAAGERHRRFGEHWLWPETNATELASIVAAELRISSTAVITVHASSRRELKDFFMAYVLLAAVMSV
ncbi:hypothetical protein GPECTOR_1g135 [Gonium pectorale]|uniref:Hexosyltransferase n=1 Tax=Gonium pectorale TaxID=33097 RepID=A0A150H2T9_GONPE|nr:hypothetical protein GPECTOR_1g135 [Gonium pectorale]|eukprot:KXZ56158.1 hypothetical protein GPECTOR_1g135 [Gonium pectorale]